MASRGRGCIDSGRGNNLMLLAFDQQAFMEAIGAATATIAQASADAATISQASAMAGQGGVGGWVK